MFARFIARTAMLLVVAVAPAFAQDTTDCGCAVIRAQHQPNAFQRRSSGVFSFIQSRPTGAFGDNVHFGYGGNAAYMFRLDDAGIFSLRADAGVLVYGHESKEVPLSSTIGGRILVDVSTMNYIYPLTIGPQITWPSGSIRPYANAGIGGQFFVTQSSVKGSENIGDFASTTNYWDKTGLWTAGGGVYIPLSQRGLKVMLDLGAQFVSGGRARYLKPGSIEDLPDAQLRITPMESETHMTLVRVGLKVSL
jgi:hypothetical protein